MTEQEREQVAHAVARAELVKRALIMLTTAMVSVLLFLGYVTMQNTEEAVDEIRATQQTGSPVLVALQNQADRIEQAVAASTVLNEAILPCFDPDSKCSKERDAREAARQGAIIAGLIATRYCADQVLPESYTERELTQCVGRRIGGPEGVSP